MQVTGADPSNWPGFDNPPLDGVADGVGYYKMDEPSTLMATLIKRVEPSYISGAETPRTRQTYTLALKQVIAKDAVTRSIIKHKVEWSSAYTTDLMTVVTSEELIPDNEKRTRFQERKDELDFWEEVTGMGTNEAYYFHPLAFIDNMMRMEAYYEAVIHVTSEIKTAIVLNANGSVASAPDQGGYNGLANGYTNNNNIYSKKRNNDLSWFPTFKAYFYRGIGTEAKAKLAKDIENGNRKFAETNILELARHTKYTTDNDENIGGTNGSYNKDSPVPPTAENHFYEVRYRLSGTYRYRISSLREEYPAAFPDVPNNSELSSGFARIIPRLGANIIERDHISFDPWWSNSLEGCLGVRNGSGGSVPLSAGFTNKYKNISNHIEEILPELKGVYGRLYATVPSTVTEYTQHTKVWVQIDSLPDADYIINGGE